MSDARTVNRCSFEFFYFHLPHQMNRNGLKCQWHLSLQCIIESDVRWIHHAKEVGKKKHFKYISIEVNKVKKSQINWFGIPKFMVIASDNSLLRVNQTDWMLMLHASHIRRCHFINAVRPCRIFFWMIWSISFLTSRMSKSAMFNKQRAIWFDQIKIKRWRLSDINSKHRPIQVGLFKEIVFISFIFYCNCKLVTVYLETILYSNSQLENSSIASFFIRFFPSLYLASKTSPFAI